MRGNFPGGTDFPAIGKYERERWDRLTWDEKLSEYDVHNGPDCRMSTDPTIRMHGRCGCPRCQLTRSEWQRMPAPIDKPGRRGSNTMSGVNVCDRCTGLVTGLALGELAIRTSADYKSLETIAKELCPECIGEIVAVVEMSPNREGQRAYKEPWKRPADDTEDSVDKASLEQLLAAAFEKAMAAQAERQKAIEGGTIIDAS